MTCIPPPTCAKMFLDPIHHVLGGDVDQVQPVPARNLAVCVIRVRLAPDCVDHAVQWPQRQGWISEKEQDQAFQNAASEAFFN